MKSFLRKAANFVSITFVASVAAYASYWHQVHVAILAHQDHILAHLLPLSVDGMLIVASLAMSEDKAAGRYPRGWARFGFWLGAVVSTASNIASTAASWRDPLSIAVSAWAPVALLVVVEICAKVGKPKPIAPVVTPKVVETPVASPIVQAQEVVERSAATLPKPVSPAPVQSNTRTRGSGPVARRAAVSPLTGAVLSDKAPQV